MSKHKTKYLTYKGSKVKIDKDIAGLISKMWKLGINTNNSCQAMCSFLCDHKVKIIIENESKRKVYTKVLKKYCNNSIWIVFESVKDLELFYNIVAKYDTPMYDKMSCDRFVRVSNKEKFIYDNWGFGFLMNNNGVNGHWGRPIIDGKRSTCEMWIDDGCNQNDFVLRPQITFPKEHQVFIERQLDIALFVD